MINQLFNQHVMHKTDMLRHAMAANNVDILILASGYQKQNFRDDLPVPFKANSYFLELVPVNQADAFLILRQNSDSTELVLFQNDHDYWHTRDDALPSFVAEAFNVSYYKHPGELDALINDTAVTHLIGDHPICFSGRNVTRNSEHLLQFIDFHRCYKTDYELSCLQQANELAVKGHLKALELFKSGASELEIHFGYLSAIGCMESDLPYNNIICINKNASTLHHMHLDKRRPKHNLSLLIDAGASHNYYHADITRSYATEKGLYAELLTELDVLQQQLVQSLRPQHSFADLHQAAFERIGQLLIDADIIHIDPQHPDFNRIVSAFFPHGLGHLLGVQVHDKGGTLKSEKGLNHPPPERHPYLRLTRPLEENCVVTVEPGIYFIDALLKPLQEGRTRKLIDWKLVEHLSVFGGMRIEDNVVIRHEGPVNLTRQSFNSENSKPKQHSASSLFKQGKALL